MYVLIKLYLECNRYMLSFFCDLQEIILYKYICLSGKDGWTALHIASENGHTATVQALIGKGALVDLRNKVRCSIELELYPSFYILVRVAMYVLNR